MEYNSVQWTQDRRPVSRRRVWSATSMSWTWIVLVISGLTQETGGQQLGTLPVDNLLMTAPKAYVAYVDSVVTGARVGIDECVHQFQWERWNCPLHTPPILLYGDTVSANREMAFARAISSAGVTFELTRNCSAGILQNCDCSRQPRSPQLHDPWSHGGCKESYIFAEQVSRVFVDEKEGSRDARAFVNLHNNEAGRQAVRRTMKLLCKCHGVSGSCAIKTCWKQLPEFRAVGDFLKNKYRKALLADFQNGHPPREVVAYKYSKWRTGIGAIAIKKGELKQASLVYLEPSPDYCKNHSSPATVGRQCVRPRHGQVTSHAERKSCNTLCRQCGLRVRRSTVTVETSCDCKFHWCCEVRCRSCVTVQQILTCSMM